MPYFVLNDGAQLYYEDRGSGEPIVFLHGLTASHRKIAAFTKEFLQDYRCILLDLRGHGSSNHVGININIQTLAQDIHELLEYLELTDVTMIGHSLGGAVIYSYVSQFGCERVKRLVSVDQGPCARNHDWTGGIAGGKWTDDDFLADLDRGFSNFPELNWSVTKLMMPMLANLPPEAVPGMLLTCKDTCECDSFTLSGLWYSIFRTDNRPAVEQITVPFLYILPETTLYSPETAEYVRAHVKGSFTLVNNIPGTTHMILMEAPQAAADAVKAFIKEN